MGRGHSREHLGAMDPGVQLAAADSTLFGRGLDIPENKVGQPAPWSDDDDDDDDPIDVDPPLPSSGGESGVAGASSGVTRVYDVVSDRFVNPFESWTSLNVAGAEGSDIALPSKTASFQFKGKQQTADMQTSIKTIIESTYSIEQVDDIFNAFKESLPRTAAAWIETKKHSGKAWVNIFKQVKDTKNVSLGAYSLTYNPGSKYEMDALNNELSIEYDEFGRPSTNVRTALIMGKQLGTIDRYMVMIDQAATSVPGVIMAEDMYRRFMPAEFSLSFPKLATEDSGRVLVKRNGGFMENAAAMARHVRGWLTKEGNSKKVYISIRYDVGKLPGEGGYDVVIPHAFLDEESLSTVVPTSKRDRENDKGTSGAKISKTAPKRGKKRNETGGVMINAPLASSRALMGAPLQAGKVEVDEEVTADEDPATSMFYNGLLGAKEPRIAEAMVIAASNQYDRLLYCTNTSEFPTEFDLGASAPPSWWRPPPGGGAYVNVPSRLYDPENTAEYRITDVLHSVAYVTVFDKEAIDKARNDMETEIVSWVNNNPRYASLKDVFHYNPAHGGKPAGIKEFALPSEVDSSGLQNGNGDDLFVLPSLRPSKGNAFDESRRFVHNQPPLRYAWSWVRDLVTFGSTPNGGELLTSAADSWKVGLDVVMGDESIQAFLRFSTRLYTEYLQPDHHATMHVYLKALMQISKADGGVPILGFIESMSHVLALSLLHSIAMLGAYKARAQRASDLLVEGLQVCMLSTDHDMSGLEDVSAYIEYATRNRETTRDERWDAVIDILRVNADSVLLDASEFANLSGELSDHVKTFTFKDKDWNTKEIPKATPDDWANPGWLARALKAALDTAQSKTLSYRASYPSTSPYVYDVLLKGDVVLFLSLCMKNGSITGNVAGLFDGVEKSKPQRKAPPDGMDISNTDTETLPSLTPDRQTQLQKQMVSKGLPKLKFEYFVTTLLIIPIEELLELVREKDTEDSEFAMLVFWYVVAFEKAYLQRNSAKNVLRRETMMNPDTSTIAEGLKLPRLPTEALRGRYKVVKGMRDLNKESAQAKYVYDYLLENRRQWFRTVFYNLQELLVLDAVVAINTINPTVGGSDAAAASSSADTPSEPPLPPEAEEGEEEAVQEDEDDDDEIIRMLEEKMDTSDAMVDAFLFDAHALASFMKTKIFPTGPPASSASRGAGSSTDPLPDPAPSGTMEIDFNLKSLLSTHNVAYQVAVNAVFRTHVDGGMNVFTTPKMQAGRRICAPSQKNYDYLMRTRLLSSSGLEINMRLLFDWMNEDLRRLKTSLSSRDVLDINHGVDANGNYIVVTATPGSSLTSAKALIPEANVEEQSCPSTERNAYSNASTTEASDCDALRWAWVGKLTTSEERAFPDKIEKDSYRFPTYLRFATSKSKRPLVACKMTTDVCNTIGDRLHFCGAELSKEELTSIYQDHPWDTPNPTLDTLRMSKEVQKRYEYMTNYVPVAEFAAYIDALNRNNSKSMKRLVAARGLASSDHTFVQALLSVFGWDKETPTEADLSNMPKFGKSNTPPTSQNKNIMIANINFLRFYELYTASTPGDTFVPYTFDDYVLHMYSVYCRIMTMSNAYTSQTSSYHLTTSLRGVVREMKHQIAKLRQAFNALLLGIATEQRTSENGTVEVLKTLEDKRIQNFTYIWKPGSLLHGVVGQRTYDDAFPVGSPARALGAKIKAELEILGKDMAVVVGLENELSYVEACGKALYNRAFAKSSDKTAADVLNCNPSKWTQEEVDESTEAARSSNHPYWKHPMANYVNRRPLSVNWRNRYKLPPHSFGQLMPQGATSDELHWASDTMSAKCNNDFGMHAAYASYLDSLFDRSNTMNPSEKLKEHYGKAFSKWADSNAKKEFLCAPTDYSERHTSNAAERLPTYAEILARHEISKTTVWESKLTSTFDDIENEFMPSFETMRTEWFNELMESSIDWNRALAVRRHNGDVHPQARISAPAGAPTGDPVQALFVKRPTVHKEGVVDKLRSRPAEIIYPNEQDVDGRILGNKLDKLQLAMRNALYSSSTSSPMLRLLKTTLKPIGIDVLKLSDFVETESKYDFPVED